MATTSSGVDPVLGPDDLALLRRLEVVHRQRARGVLPGERRSVRTSRSPELADFRPYSVGDDVRQIDWRAYGRLEKLMLRLYVAEEESALNVVLDTSDSMTLGAPPKWPAARRLAAALAMLGLASMDRVAAGALDRKGPWSPHVRLPGGTQRLLGFLSDLEPGGAAGPDELARLRWLRPGITVVISDFLVEDDWRSTLVAMGHQSEVVLWQVLSPDEEDPRLSGDVRFREAETGRLREMTITPRVVQEYRTALGQHREGLQRQADAARGRFLHTSSDHSLEASMHAALRAGVVRRG